MNLNKFNALVSQAQEGEKSALLALLDFVKPASPEEVNLAGEVIFANLNKSQIEKEFAEQAFRAGFQRIADNHLQSYYNLIEETKLFVQALADLPLKLSSSVIPKPSHAGIRS